MHVERCIGCVKLSMHGSLDITIFVHASETVGSPPGDDDADADASPGAGTSGRAGRRADHDIAQ